MKRKKKLSTLFAVALITLMSLSTIALAETYKTSVSFKTSYSGPPRHFNGVRITYSAENTWCNQDGTFELALIKYNTDSANELVNTRTMNRRQWQASETFPNITSGDYFFSFTKNSDGYWVNGDNLVLSSSW